MNSRRTLQVVLLSGCLSVEQGCWFRKEPRKATIVIPPTPQPAPPQQLPPPPNLPPSAAVPAMKNKPEMPTLPVPDVTAPPPKTKPKRKTTPTVAAAQPIPPASSDPAANPAESPSPAPSLNPPGAPTLQPILATQEASERNRRIQQYLERARVVVLRAERGSPDTKTKELITRVRTFIQQAEESRKSDLVRAENLAERAEVLSRGLK